MYRTALAGAYPSRSRSSANASICGPLIPPRKRLNDLGAEKNFSNMGSPCWVLAIDGQHQRSKRPKFNGESRPPPKPVPKPAQRQSWLPHSPLEKTPHNAGNGELSITLSSRLLQIPSRSGSGGRLFPHSAAAASQGSPAHRPDAHRENEPKTDK